MWPDFTVSQFGVDAYGRAVLLTEFMHEWLEAYFDLLEFRPRIMQGAFMERIPGGGAAASSGAHDEGGCVDLETAGLTTAQIDRMVKISRDNGGAAYRRDSSAKHGGMPQHLHITLGADRPLSDMAQMLWSSYLGNGDGLAGDDGRPSDAPDYEWRPSPLVLTPPEEMFMLNDDDRAWIDAKINEAIDRIPTLKFKNPDDPTKAKWALETILASIWRRQDRP